MINLFISKRLFLLLSVIFLILSIFIILLTGCRLPSTPLSERVSDKINEKLDDVSEGQVFNDFPKGFPSSVPIYPGAIIVESVKNEADGKITFKVILQCKGAIEKLSDWYEQALEKDWSIGSVSKGDMGDWSEFYAEAQNEYYFLTVYLYHDKGSGKVSIDLNVKNLAEGETVAENTEQDTEVFTSENTEESAVQSQSSQSYSGELENNSIAFVCASVGAAWNIKEHFPQLDISVYDEYQFDKGYRIQEILDSDKPDIMIIKECAAYFPPDSQGSSMSAYQDLIRDWVNLCRGQGVIPVLTTVVPIDPANPSNAGQVHLDSILEFNDWIKQYCTEEDVSVLDLEAALRISSSNRALNTTYDSGDGLHPNERAYTEKLDNIIIPALERALEIGD
jgi:hypothetical protein